jgi:transposase
VAKEAIMKKVTQNTREVELKGADCYIGVDVHKLTYYVSILTTEGQRVDFSCPANPAGLIRKLKDMGIHILSLAYESGPTGYELAWQVQESGLPIIVAAASKIPRPITAGGKTDRLDGRKLAEYLAKGMLKSITIPSREEFGLRELERGRQQLIKSRKKLRQQIKSFLLKNHIEAPHGLTQWTKSGMEALKRLELGHRHLRLTLDSYLRQLESTSHEIEGMKVVLSKEMISQGKEEQIKNLRTIPGVGETISHTFTAEIFRPERFDCAEEICAYVGLAPIISQSGQSRGLARLGCVGQIYLRSILVEAAWILIGKEIRYRQFYNKIRGKTNLPQKAITAVARKLLVIMWRVAVEKRAYQPQNI